MKVALHCPIPIALAVAAFGVSEDVLRASVPVTKSGMVRLLDASYVRDFGPGHNLIGMVGNDGYEAGDSAQWDLNVAGTARYVTPQDLADDIEALAATAEEAEEEADKARIESARQAYYRTQAEAGHENRTEAGKAAHAEAKRRWNRLRSHVERKRAQHATR